MSDLLKHVVVGDFIGEVSSGSRRPWLGTAAVTFGLGLLSHAVMDMIEADFTVNWFNSVAFRQALPFVVLQILGISLVSYIVYRSTRSRPREARLRAFGILGAVAPDIIDGVYAIMNPAAWYSGELLLPWHVQRGQVPLVSMWGTLTLSLYLLLARYGSPIVWRTLAFRLAPARARAAVPGGNGPPLDT